MLSAWARHFRNHYCLDAEIDFLRCRCSRQNYLTNIKFPCETSKLGPGIRAGDFGEILVSDYLQWILGYWVPRVRWASKVVRDESPKGSDVIGFRFHEKAGEASTKDVLFVFESKTKFSASKINRLQDAINDSAKDHIRIDESLNFIKQKFFEKNEIEQAQKIERFQSPVDMPYKKPTALLLSFLMSASMLVNWLRQTLEKFPTQQNPRSSFPILMAIILFSWLSGGPV